MASTVEVRYEGELNCTAVHGRSGDRLLTDAPPDNQGKGEHFSPTDLVAAAIGTCTLTVMGIAAQTHGISLAGARAAVQKEMSAVPRRHISRLAVAITIPGNPSEADRRILERAAQACPVCASLGPHTDVDLSFDYP